MRLNHVLIYVADVEIALGFYAGKLGFDVVEHGLPGYARVLVPGGDATIGLHRVSSRPTPPWNEGVRLYFEVDTLDEVCAAIAAKGVEFEQMPADMPWRWRHAYLRDPDGHLLSLYRSGEERTGGRTFSRPT